MCIQLMQEQILEKISWLMAEIGMGGASSNEEMVKVNKFEPILMKLCNNSPFYRSPRRIV